MKFEIDFEDESAKKRISYEIPDAARLRVEHDATRGMSVFGNADGLLTLARILIKVASCSYEDGFHVHLRQDFSTDERDSEVLTIALANNPTSYS